MENKSNKKIGIGVSVLVVALVVFVTTFLGKNTSNQVASNTDTSNSNNPTNSGQQNSTITPVKDSENSTSNSNQNTTTVVPVDTTKNSTSSYAYKNGTYTAVGSYMSPGGQDQIGVTLTIKNDIVTDSSLSLMAGDHTSARFEQIFADNYKTYVVGKNIADLKLTKVSRSSLTPKGFNDALAQIRSQAKA